MKEKKPFIIELIIGILLLGIGLFTRFGYYSSLISAIGCGLASSSAIQLLRLAYWQSPKRQEQYEAKQKESYINRVDERKNYLRMRAGYLTYQLMTFSLLILAFVFALLHLQPWIIASPFLLFLFQWIAGVFIYHILEQRM